MTIKAIARLLATAKVKDPVLDKLVDALDELNDDQVADNRAGNEVEVYYRLSLLVKDLKTLGWKGTAREFTKDGATIVVSAPAGKDAKNTTYIRIKS